MAYYQQFNAYKQAAHTVHKTRQIVMLYDGVIRFIQQAKAASQEKRIEDRYNLLVKASSVIIGLQSSLDFDQSQEIATTLYDYYDSVDARIMSLHRNANEKDYDTLIDDLKQMREVWHNIDTGLTPAYGANNNEMSGSMSEAGISTISNIIVSV